VQRKKKSVKRAPRSVSQVVVGSQGGGGLGEVPKGAFRRKKALWRPVGETANGNGRKVGGGAN